MSQHDALTLWLLGEGPDPGPEVRAAFLELGPPPSLSAATLAAVARERGLEAPPARPANDTRAWLRWGALALGVAAGLLLATRAPDPVGDPARMTARGESARQPAVDLKVAVSRAQQVQRLGRGARAPGDRLFFRVWSDAPGWATLLHVHPGGVDLLDQRQTGGGELDLTRGGEALAWTVEEGDPSSVFVLVGSGEVPELGALTGALADLRLGGVPGDAEAACARVGALGLRCDAEWVEVEP